MTNRTLFAFSVLIILPLVIGCRGNTTESLINADAAKVESSPEVVAAEGDWPWWHGPDRNATSVKFTVPEKLDPEQHLNWKVPVPGEGHASPVVVGDRVILAVAESLAASMSLVCYDAKDGSELWKTKLHEGTFMRSHQKNSHASATPACDGSTIYTAFMINDGIQVSAVSMEGKIKWQKPAGKFQSRHGYGSSPAIYKSLVIVNGDNGGYGFVSALDRETGKIVWRVKRPLNASFATPVVANTGGRNQLFISGHNKLISYNPASGEELWNAKGTSPTTANTAAWNDEIVITSGGYPEQGVIAIKTDGSGKVLWENSVKLYVPSPLIVGDKVLVTNDGGILHCLDIANGKTLWKERLNTDCSGSPVMIGDTIIQGTESGRVYCYQIADEFKSLSEFDLDSRIMTTPAVSAHGLFIRTDKSLYCFSLDSGDPEVASAK